MILVDGAKYKVLYRLSLFIYVFGCLYGCKGLFILVFWCYIGWGLLRAEGSVVGDTAPLVKSGGSHG